MRVEINTLNVLPMSTWGHTQVNQASLRADIPDIAAYKGNPFRNTLPEGIQEANSAALPEIATGMGDETLRFVQAHRSGGFSLQTKPGVKLEAPISLVYTLDGENLALAEENVLIAGENSQVTVLLEYRSANGTAGFHGGCTRIHAGKNSRVTLIQVNLLEDDCIHFDDVGVLLEEGAQVSVLQAELGGGQVFAGCKSTLLGKESEFTLDTLYFGDKSRRLDINYVADHLGTKTKSHVQVNGALLAESHKTLRSTLNFVKGAKYATGQESEYTLLFSPQARNLTAPLILCGEEDVEGQHAATTGKIDENKLFYLMSRGLDEFSARKLLIEALFHETAEKIPDEALQQTIFKYISERLSPDESVS